MEDEAKAWIMSQPGVSRETVEKIGALVALIARENEHQNLVAPSSIAHIWSRHIADSAQLLQWGTGTGLWIDVGSGAGLPGLVIATLRDAPMILVEPRRKRAAFLVDTARALALPHVEVVQRDVRRVIASASVISARAVASLCEIFSLTVHLCSDDTRYILPKGRSAPEELDRARDTWQGVFHVKQSVTDPDSRIVVASHIARKSG